MDVQKFMFVVSEADTTKLYRYADDLLTDIKNCLYSLAYWQSTIIVNIPLIAQEQPRKDIADAMQSIESLTESYKLLASQRKALLVRISEVKRFSVPQTC